MNAGIKKDLILAGAVVVGFAVVAVIVASVIQSVIQDEVQGFEQDVSNAVSAVTTPVSNFWNWLGRTLNGG
jgi:hypothetical protein